MAKEKNIEEVMKNFDEQLEKDGQVVEDSENKKDEAVNEQEVAGSVGAEEAEKSAKKKESKKEESDDPVDDKDTDTEDKDNKKRKNKKDKDEDDDNDKEDEEKDKEEAKKSYESNVIKSLELVVKSYAKTNTANHALGAKVSELKDEITGLQKSIAGIVEALEPASASEEETAKSLIETSNDIDEPASKSVDYVAKNANVELDNEEEKSDEKSEEEKTEKGVDIDTQFLTSQLISKSASMSRQDVEQTRKSIFNIMDGKATDADVTKVNYLLED